MESDESCKSATLRTNLYATLDQVKAGRRVVIERHAAPMAALIPMTDYWELIMRRARQRRPKEEFMPTQRLVIANASGGEGKSTVARELAYSLALLGYKVALFDLDPQASLTKALGLHDDPASPARTEEATVGRVFSRDEPPPLPQPLQVHGVDVWPANDALNSVDNVLNNDFARAANLREALDAYLSNMPEPYDFVILDTKPQRTNFLTASVAAADHLLVPVSGIKGLENLDVLLKLVKVAKGIAPNLTLRAFIPNRIRENVDHHKELLHHLHTDLSRLAPITSNVRDSLATMGGATQQRLPAVLYKPKAKVSEDIGAMTLNVLKILGVKVPA
ncbi:MULTISPECIES: AAA family ATPase [Deinococcus]|uniref:AAA domain-containing protein n=1 Tax=Deinococcus aluminii TaxID=1656885 RepID=A0ABP9XHI1_9DEIO|nr:ParA family protein [Deinococcus sp. DB0503]